ncbi:MAG: hypothetical protein WC865_02670 [Bacteroidales bacterium]
MKYLSILLLSIIFSWGGKIQVIKSTSQEWVGGLQESGYGTDYKLTIKAKAGSDQLQIEDLWVGDIHMKVGVNAFKKGSQVSLKAGITFRPDADGQISPLAADSTKKPFNFKGEGLLGYTYKGHKAYLVIAEFKKLEKIIYP